MAELKINCKKCSAKLDLGECNAFDTVACPDCGAPLRVPMPFDAYLLEKPCGQGGGAVVYRALEPDLARRVAVKIELESGNAETAARFINAARITGKLNLPGIIPIYNCGKFENRAFLVMRYMEHGDLEHLLKQKKLPPPSRILAWILALIPVLTEALKQNIIHHDIKPANIMLTAEDEPKLGDWDTAGYENSESAGAADAMWASPIYASPERIYTGMEDHKGDIFSLGVTIYELLTYVAPFGLHGDAAEFYSRRKQMDFKPLSTFLPDAAPALSLLVSGMLEFQAENRPEYEEISAIIKEILCNYGDISSS